MPRYSLVFWRFISFKTKEFTSNLHELERNVEFHGLVWLWLLGCWESTNLSHRFCCVCCLSAWTKQSAELKTQPEFVSWLLAKIIFHISSLTHLTLKSPSSSRNRLMRFWASPQSDWKEQERKIDWNVSNVHKISFARFCGLPFTSYTACSVDCSVAAAFLRVGSCLTYKNNTQHILPRA